MNFMNYETQLDLRLAGSKEFGLLLKLIFYNSFEVITGFPRPFNQRNQFKTQYHAIVSRCATHADCRLQTADLQTCRLADCRLADLQTADFWIVVTSTGHVGVKHQMTLPLAAGRNGVIEQKVWFFLFI